ncbi:MAG: class I SAM-dependent methyltransferase [Planifilum fulgidum]
MDWKAWQQRWDRQQERYLPYREQSFEAMVQCVAEGVRGRGRILDLACGCGSVTERLLKKLPKLQVVGVDIDPVLLKIARGAFEGDERVRWMERDLCDPDWSADLEPESFDAVVTATALHWLEESVLLRVYRDVARLLRPGGCLSMRITCPWRTGFSLMREGVCTAGGLRHPRIGTIGKDGGRRSRR